MELLGKTYSLVFDSNLLEMEGRLLVVRVARGRLRISELQLFWGVREKFSEVRELIPQFSEDSAGMVEADRRGDDPLTRVYRWADKLVAAPCAGKVFTALLGVDPSFSAAYLTGVKLLPVTLGGRWLACAGGSLGALAVKDPPFKASSSLRHFPALGPGAMLYSAAGGPSLYRLAVDEGDMTLSASLLPSVVPDSLLAYGAALQVLPGGRAFLIGGVARSPLHYVNTVLELTLEAGPSPHFSHRVLCTLPVPGFCMPGSCTLLGRYLVVFGGQGGDLRNDMFVIDTSTGEASDVIKAEPWALGCLFPALRVWGRELLILGGWGGSPAGFMYRLDLFRLARLIRSVEMGRRLLGELEAANLTPVADSGIRMSLSLDRPNNALEVLSMRL